MLKISKAVETQIVKSTHFPKVSSNGISKILEESPCRGNAGIENTWGGLNLDTIPFTLQKERSLRSRVWELFASRITAFPITSSTSSFPLITFLATILEITFPGMHLRRKALTCGYLHRRSKG